MILSICIPSYNRWDRLNENLKSISQAKSDDFEVVIVDNCSPQDPEEMLDLPDNRFRIVKRKKPVSGAYNRANCVTFAKGRFALICLDKDGILGSGLDRFIECLKKYRDTNLNGGICKLKAKESEGSVDIIRNDAIMRFGYHSYHPSGFFYKTNIVKKFDEIASDEIHNSESMHEYYLAKCASQGAMMYYAYPLMIFTDKDYYERNGTNRTLSYSENSNDYYFLPRRRIQEFFLYIKALSDLGLGEKVRIKKVTQLYYLTVRQITRDYKFYLGNEDRAYHYRYETREVTFAEMLENVRSFNRQFMQEEIKDVSTGQKISIIISENIRFQYRRLKKIYFFRKRTKMEGKTERKNT